jgi:beta-catenin-like protein 1
MDVGDLLSFKPETIPKRKQDEDNGDDGRRQAAAETSKKQKFDEKILEIVNSQAEDEDEAQVLDENGLKKLALLFEKRVLKNQVTRLKFANEPAKFFESESDLYDSVNKLQAVATVPDLYPLMISLNVMSSLLELLAHPNTDIVAAIVEILQEFTDVDVLHESTEGDET